MAFVMAEAFAAIDQLLDAHFDGIGHESFSVEIKKAEPRQAKLLEQALLRVLPFELAQLFGRHAAPIGRELPVQVASNVNKYLLVGCGEQSGGELLLDHGQAPFQVFQIELGRRIEQRHKIGQGGASLRNSPRQFRVRWIAAVARLVPVSAIFRTRNARSSSREKGSACFPLRFGWGPAPADASCFCAAASSTASTQYARLLSGRRAAPRALVAFKRAVDAAQHRIERNAGLLPGLHDGPIERRDQQMRAALAPEVLFDLREVIEVVE